MDYYIGLYISDGTTLIQLLQELALRHPELVFLSGGLIIGGEMRAIPAKSAGTDEYILKVSKGNDHHLYLLLKSYFDWFNAPDAAVSITFEGTPGIQTIAITNDEKDELVENEFGSVVAAQELLATEAVFVSAWPYLINFDDKDGDYEEEEAPFIVLDKTRQSLISPLLGDIDDNYVETNFFVFGKKPVEIMDKLLTVPEYQELDPEYLDSDLPDIDESIIVVSFDTDRGPVVEIRFPLQQKKISMAQKLLAQRNIETLNAEIYFVVDRDESQEKFTIQPLHSDGSLGPPEMLTLTFF